MEENEDVTLEELRGSKRDQIIRLADSYGARNLRVFGSVARGDFSAVSDIDFLVDLYPEQTLMDLCGFVITGTGGNDKTKVMGILKRGSKAPGSKVRVKVVDNTMERTLQSQVRAHVLAGSALFSDALTSYEGLNEFQHEVVDHVAEYVRGEVHTTGLENFWSLVERCLSGTYISVEPFYLFRYLGEQVFRYNNRKMNDGDRFDIVLRAIVGKYLTWDRLTGKDQVPDSLRETFCKTARAWKAPAIK
jgi:hypothetical protein